MNKLARAAYWTLPPLFAVWFYWLGIKTFFLTDDFAWLNHATEFNNFREMMQAIFMPMAQGTIRPWSDRLFFMLGLRLFGVNPVPFHICIFATQVANILLLLSIVRRITGSRVAGFTAALFWILNTSTAKVMLWTSAYNQPLCALFILGAFHFLLRSMETGKRRYQVLQWVVFLLGFGALELNVVYPALAAAYTLLCARKHFTRTLPLFVPSIAFAVVHRMVAPVASGAYAMHFGLPMLRTLWTYWTWAMGPGYYASIVPMSQWLVVAATLPLTAGVLGFTAWRWREGDRLPVFGLAWFLLLIAPVLALSEHLTEYYPFLPSIGLAILGGWAMALVWVRPLAWRVVAAVLVLVYFGFAIPSARRTLRWDYERARSVRKVVEGVASAHELHPQKIILLDGVEDQLFWSGVLDHPFGLVGTQYVYLTPGTEKLIAPQPAYGDPAEFVIPPGPTFYALAHEMAVVYSVRGERLRNITKVYSTLAPAAWESMKPSRIDVSNPAAVYLLGPTWHQIEGNHRWMPNRATIQLAGPARAGAKLHLVGSASPVSTRLLVSVDGVPLAERPLRPGDGFDFEWELPAALVGKDGVEVAIETDKTVTPPEDGRPLGLVFGVIEVR